MKSNKQDNYTNISGSLEAQVKDNKRYLEYRDGWINNPKMNKVSKFPLNVDIELTNACNLKCPHCARTNNTWGSEDVGFMDKKLVKKILDEVNKEGGYCVKFSLRGEPLLHKDLIEILKYAKDTNLEEFYFNTNATLLTEKLSKELVDLKLPRISISVSGWDKETFEKSQYGASFEKVCENIKKLKEYRDSIGSKFPRIRIQVVLTPETQKNLKKFERLWEGMADELGGIEYREEKNEIKNENKKDNGFRCEFPWRRLVVLWDGTTYPCLFHGVRSAEELILGNVKYDLLKKLWNSDKINKIRKKHVEGKSHNIKSCANCSYRATIINRIVKK